MFSKLKKPILLIIIACFTAISLLFSFPRPAKAQWVVTSPDVTALMIQERVKKTIGATIMQAGTIALVNVLNSFVQKLAYDAAVWVASGGSGQKPLFDGKSVGDYFASAALDSAMVGITELADLTVGQLGFDVCAPAIPSIILKIQLGVIAPFGPPKKPRCEWNNFVKNWENLIQTTTGPEVLKKVGVMFEPGQSELSYSFEVNNRVLARMEEKTRQAVVERLNNAGWQSVKNAVTKQVTTPANVVKESFGKSYLDTPYAQQTASWSAFGDALGRGAWQILPAALQTFANTLVSQTMQKMMSGLFPGSLIPEGGGSRRPDAPVELTIGRRQAQEIYSDFIRPRIATANNYDPLIEFTACPSNTEDKQINNCVLDDNFAAAVRLASQGAPITLSEAIAQGHLDGAKPLISSQDSRNEQNDCYSQGYCFSNLVKLRKARIIPVGWELAAEESEVGRPVTIKEAMDNFNNCDPKTGGRTSQYKWCHLIDPNWVLRLPKTQCLAQTFGPTLVSSEGPNRAEYCADPITCISEDGAGNCLGGWGYCTKEKNIWRIAADQCPSQFNTCLTYTSRQNVTESYLKNTVDFAVCNEGNVGCRRYSTSQKDGAWELAPGKTAYFNKNLEKCEARDAGCGEFYSKEGGLAYNLLPNSSFETIDDQGNVPGWTFGAGVNWERGVTNAYHNEGSVKFSFSRVSLSQSFPIKLELNTAYTISGFMKKTGLDIGAARIGLRLSTDSAGLSLFDPANLITTCAIVGNDLFRESAAGDSYGRLECALLTPAQTLYARVITSSRDLGVGTALFFDALQFEEGAAATPYLSSGYGEVKSVFLKTAPDYLKCEVGSADSRCAAYAPVCRAEEVGCENYKPASGDPAVPGMVTVNDLCPQECVGYETYKQEKTLYESEKFPLYLLYLIPLTAKTCGAADQGCDEFTNLETEGREYFNFIRQCIKPDLAKDAVFYTWEGSEQVGYQLKTHRLLFEGTSDNPAPAQIGGADPASCDANIFKLPLADPKYNPDCREFYNAKGSVFYRQLSKTIISTPDCTQYRKTESIATDCAGSGGLWDSAKQACFYFGYKPESRSCQAAANSCRAYSGSAASNLRLVFQDDFEGGTSGWDGGEISSESLSAGGHSLKFPAGAAPKTALTKPLSKLVSAKNTYLLNFWAKGPAGGDLTAEFSDTVTEVKAGGNIATLKGDWRFYEMGPFNLRSVGANPVFSFTLSGGTGYFIDNIILKEVNQKLYLIKNSWQTPLSCDQTLGGAPLPQAMLGCKAYKDKNNQELYLKSFSSLCREGAAGCRAFADTQNSASDKNEIYNVLCILPHLDGGECKSSGEIVCVVDKGASSCRFKMTGGAMPTKIVSGAGKKPADYQRELSEIAKEVGATTLIARDEATIAVSADQTAYLVDNGKNYCQNKDLGCRALGEARLYEPAASVAATVYFKDRPNDYSSLLCTVEAEGCESFTSAKGIDFFRIPQSACEFREGGAGKTGGWFKKGKDEPCYAGFIKDGAYGIWRNADKNYNGSVGICPGSQNLCAEFIDPLDTAGAKSGKPYYLLDNEKLKTLTADPICAGKAGLEGGCILFNKTADINSKWSAAATYALAQKEKEPVAPAPSYGFCEYLEKTPLKSEYLLDNSRFCVKDADCPAGAEALGDFTLKGFTASYTGKCIPETKPKLDTNTIIKVSRDRECGEWLACKSSYTAYDPMTGKKRTVCGELALCDKFQSTVGSSALCANFVTKNPDSGKLLNADTYSRRPVGWSSLDYSGFSLSGKFPVSDIKFKDGALTVSGKLIDGREFDAASAEKLSCRGYPEPDAPYPAALGFYDLNGRLEAKNQFFNNANLCENNQNCDCDYTKLIYGGITTSEYVSYGNRAVARGICQGGSRDGLPCIPGIKFEDDPKNACGRSEEGGACALLKRQDDVIGWRGYCLERDLSTPINGEKNQKACLTWLPQEITPGARDIYNQFRTAGYVPPLGAGKYYCLQAAGRWDPNSRNQNNKYDNFIATKVAPDLPTRCPTPDKMTRFCSTGEMIKLSPKFANVSIHMDQDSDAGLIKDSFQKFVVDPTLTTNPQIYKDEIDLIRIKAVGGSNTPGSWLPNPGMVFYIRSNQPITNYLAVGEPCSQTKTDYCTGEEGSILPGMAQRARSLSSGNQWYFRFDDGSASNDVPPRNYLDINLFDYIDKGDFGEAQVICDNGKEASQDSFALRFNFDPITGLLTGIDAEMCNSGADLANLLELEISVRLREICATVADVAASKNAADTQKVWRHLPENQKAQKIPGTIYSYNYEMPPYGSAASDLDPGANNRWFSYYSAGRADFAGVPWSCEKDCGSPKPTDNDMTTIDFDPKDKNVTISGTALDYAINTLKEVFLRAFRIFKFDKTERGYKTIDCQTKPNEPGCYNFTTAAENFYKPKIYSFNPNTKLDNGQFSLLEANKILVNNSSAAFDIAGKQYLAALRFYFWAETSQMPIKSLKVDWEGDGIFDFETTDGMYKNHKPRCAPTNDKGATTCGDKNIVCKASVECPVAPLIGEFGAGKSSCGTTAETELIFGNSPDACDESYFELQHIYTCEKTTGESCEFTPKVVITDNWGIVSEPATGPKIRMTVQ